jgi:hypothetical protein
MMLIALGGLQSISDELYEAADVDGTLKWFQFWNITAPLLRPVMIPAITLGIVWTFHNINVVWLVSNMGEPADSTHILASCVYKAAFNMYLGALRRHLCDPVDFRPGLSQKYPADRAGSLTSKPTVLLRFRARLRTSLITICARRLTYETNHSRSSSRWNRYVHLEFDCTHGSPAR